MQTEWLAQHPFLLRDLRRLRKKARLLRFALGPLFVMVLLLGGLFALPDAASVPGLSRTDLAMVIVALVHSLCVICATDPLGGWVDETISSRVESLHLLPLAARHLVEAAVERRFYLKLMTSALFLPFYVVLCIFKPSFLLPSLGVYVLLGLAAWTTGPLSSTELATARNAFTPASGGARRSSAAPGWLLAIILLFPIAIVTPGLYATMQDPSVRLALGMIGLGTNHLIDLSLMSLPLLLGGYVLRPEPFFRFSIPPILFIAALAYCTREMRILTAARMLRSEVIVITVSALRTIALTCPPTDRLREDIPIRRHQIVRGLLFQIGVFGFLWPLFRFVPLHNWTYVLLPLLALGALAGVAQSSSGSRSLFLPGRVEKFFEGFLPAGTSAGMVVVPRLAQRIIAEAVGWELLVVGFICLAGGVLPSLLPGQSAALLLMTLGSVVTAEACAVGYTLEGLPRLWALKKDWPRWNSGALLTAGSPGLVLGVYLAPLFILLLVGLNPCPVPLSWVAASPLVGWGYAIVDPTAANLYPALWLPAVVLGWWIAVLLLQDRARQSRTRNNAIPAGRIPPVQPALSRQRRPANAAPSPAAAWVSGWLYRLMQKWDTPFVNLEWARMQRKPGAVGSPVAVILVLNGAGVCVAAAMYMVGRAFTIATDHGDHGNLLDIARDLRWLTVLWEHCNAMDAHPWNLGVITACAAVITLAVGPLFSLLGAANTFDRNRKTLTNEGNLAYILTTPLSDAELFWSMVKGSIFSHLSFTIAAIAVAAPLSVVSLLMGIPALFILTGVAVSLGISLAGIYLLAVVSACTGPERWRSFWASILGMGLAAACACTLTSVMYEPSASISTTVEAFLITLILLVSTALSLGFFKAGLNGIHRYRAADVDVKTA